MATRPTFDDLARLEPGLLALRQEDCRLASERPASLFRH
jgi:hypothetical protein